MKKLRFVGHKLETNQMEEKKNMLFVCAKQGSFNYLSNRFAKI